jgi:nucleotide-binding universal stress UspA family protein
MFKQIMVPLDGSAFAESALRTARSLAQKFESEITLCHVVHVTEFMATESTELILDARRVAIEQANRYVDALQQSLRSEGLIVHKQIIDQGNIADALVGVANNGVCDLVVMTTHGRSGVRRWLLGSVADRLVRAVNVPVLLVRDAAHSVEI